MFKPVIKKILSLMGESPHDFLLNFKLKEDGYLFSSIKYRFNENEDILCLLYVMNKTLRQHGSMEVLFKKGYKDADANVGEGLGGFISGLLAVDTSPVYGKNIRPAGFLQFFPSPQKGSACKRMNLF